MTPFPSDPDNEALRNAAEALTESGQAVSIYDAEDRLRYANEIYRGMFPARRSRASHSSSPTIWRVVPITE